MPQGHRIGILRISKLSWGEKVPLNYHGVSKRSNEVRKMNKLLLFYEPSIIQKINYFLYDPLFLPFILIGICAPDKEGRAFSFIQYIHRLRKRAKLT